MSRSQDLPWHHQLAFVLADQTGHEIAIGPNWRQRGLGELLLLNLLKMATNEPAKLVTLEVRRGNIAAQQLYRKFRFEIVGERKRYYQGKEDALLIVQAWLDATFQGGRHERRVGKIES